MKTTYNTLPPIRYIDNKENMLFSCVRDCHICLSEGFEALNRVLVTVKGKSKIATLYFSNDGILQPGGGII
jgi:thymidine phosphorylase